MYAHKVILPTKRTQSSFWNGRWLVVLLLFVIGLVVVVFYVETSLSDREHLRSLMIAKKTLIATPPTLPAADVAVIPNPPQQSPYAYVTLISGIDSGLRYRGFLYNTILMSQSLRNSGSKADFIVMLGISDKTQKTHPSYLSDVSLLHTHGVRTYELPRLLDDQITLGFAEMALLKVTPFNFTSYSKFQFFDGDILPTANLDCFFSLTQPTFTAGTVSPVNSGWFLGIPSQAAFSFFVDRAVWRLARDWDAHQGWGIPIHDLTYRGGKLVKQWDFNGADMDQGLFTHFFFLLAGGSGGGGVGQTAKSGSLGSGQGARGMVIDTDLHSAQISYHGPPLTTIPLSDALACCDGRLPTDMFIHFTGRSKPWMKPLDKTQKPQRVPKNTLRWLKLLDSLKMEVNSSNIYEMNFGSSLGFFNANFPKGGYSVENNKDKDKGKQQQQRKGQGKGRNRRKEEE